MAANSLVLPIQKNKTTEMIYPKVFVFNEKLTVADVVLSSGVSSAQFKIGSANYTQTSLKGVTLQVGAELSTQNIVISDGFENVGISIIFNK